MEELKHNNWKLSRKFFTFGVVGVVNTLIDWVVFYVLCSILPPSSQSVSIAKAASYFVGMCCSFVLNTQWTFRDNINASKMKNLSAYIPVSFRFLLVGLFCLGINNLIYLVLSDRQGFEIFPLIVTTLVTYIVGFGLNNIWTYGKINNEIKD